MIFANETWVDASQDVICGESDWYETNAETVGQLFRSCRKNLGRCTGKAFIDAKGEPRHVGWIFQKRTEYLDDPWSGEDKGMYLLETWVTFRKEEPAPHCDRCGVVHGSGDQVSMG